MDATTTFYLAMSLLILFAATSMRCGADRRERWPAEEHDQMLRRSN